jgi:hypothetical protein
MACTSRLSFLAAICAVTVVSAVDAQAIATSPGPQSVSVTVYRDPNRAADTAMNLGWLNGYALVSEVRTIDIPAGEADIRFEGVAGGIIPESAIITGLPDGVVEKNQDAYLLSPSSLLDRSLGKRVHIRRTSRATGKVTEEDAIIRTGKDGAVVLQTEAGFEALRCSGLPETIVYDQVPEGLSAKPTLSVRTRSRAATRATMTLSYLATGFDWQANYIATLAPSGDRADLFGWVTLGNGDETGFVNAATQAVAGKPNRESNPPRLGRQDGALYLQCWPQATTSDISAPPPAPPPAPMADMAGEIIVTAQKRSESLAAPAMKALQENLGDLKLYRIPVPVTVAANSQKQVALLEKSSVAVQTFYRATISPWMNDDNPVRATRILKTRNRKQEGLGVPLPAGGVVLFAGDRDRPVLIGEGSVEDKAIGEDVEIEIGAAPGVFVRTVRTSVTGNNADYRLIVTNDQSKPVRFDAEFDGIDDSAIRQMQSVKLGRRNGRPVWSVTVPANGSAALVYRVRSDS